MKKHYYLPTILVFLVFYVLLVWQAPSSWNYPTPKEPEAKTTVESHATSLGFSDLIQQLYTQYEAADQYLAAINHLGLSDQYEQANLYALRQQAQTMEVTFRSLHMQLTQNPPEELKTGESVGLTIKLVLLSKEGLALMKKGQSLLTDLQYLVSRKDREMIHAFTLQKLNPYLKSCQQFYRDYEKEINFMQTHWPDRFSASSGPTIPTTESSEKSSL